MKIIDDEFMVCADCLMIIANGDDSGLDYHYGKDAAERLAKIEAGLSAVSAVSGYVSVGDSDRDDEFSTRDCDCCGTTLAGSRHHCVVIE